MPSPSQPAGETEHERLNRELDQLLSELRVALPGVQVLLAFLLTVPFSDRFDAVTAEASGVFVASVTLTAVASILLIAPVVQHRLRFRDGTKEETIKTANLLALIGAACLALAIGCAVYVVGVVGFPDTPVRWIGPVLVVVAALTWFVLPLRFRPNQTPPPGDPS
ncbi:MAG TPA: DUF6328 family protein [Acidimicrobiales bacterium]|nr:DUF6328 family protein [Acidimicrobiales bacterium]